MVEAKDKISVRQAVILFLMMTMSAGIRLFPQLTARYAEKAGWLTPVIAMIPMVLLIYIINSFFQKNKDGNLSDVFYNVLGQVIGRIVVFLYLIWISMLLTLYVRYYSERILSSMMPSTANYFLIIVMLILVFIGAKSGIVTIARMNEIFLGIFLIVFLFTFFLSIPQIKYNNLMNVSYLDIWPVTKTSYSIFSIWGYLLFIFFFGDKINNKEKVKHFSFRGTLVLFVFSTLLLIMSIGTLGPTLASHMSIPYFVVVKNISIFGTIERIESVLLAIWVISDFVVITVLTFIIASMLKSIFKLKETKSIITPIIIFAGIGALFFFKNRFELEAFSNKIALPTNIIFEFIIPFLIFGIGKLRKKI